MENCKFYELDVELKAEADADTAELKAKGYDVEAMMPEVPETEYPEILDTCCGKFCKYMKVGEGFPGETCYCCTHPECARIIHVEFDQSAVE